MKWYQTLCRFCSNPDYPEFRFFYEKDGVMTCSNCGAVIKNVELEENNNFTRLEVIKRGRERNQRKEANNKVA